MTFFAPEKQDRAKLTLVRKFDTDVLDVEPEDLVERADDELFLTGFLENLFESEIDHRVDVKILLLVFHGIVPGPGLGSSDPGVKMRKETTPLSKIRIFFISRLRD